uniref:Uncharacterized protein n=1 Tax=Amphimedon queenslandica TaxID=400682 RepID=A0A1X7V882_AMPQE
MQQTEMQDQTKRSTLTQSKQASRANPSDAHLPVPIKRRERDFLRSLHCLKATVILLD